MTTKTLLFLLSGLLALGESSSGLVKTKAETSPGNYLFSFFRGNGEDGLYLAYSHDGLSWKVINNDKPLVEPKAGRDKLMRDPCILLGKDGMFHMVWTVSWNEKGIGYASSKDLIHWSDQNYIPVMEHEPRAENCWAPELIYDDQKGQYLIFWSTTIPGRFPETDSQSNQGPPAPGRNHRIYYATTKDFKTFSKTKLLYDQGFNVIDASIIKVNSQYVMFLKDETNKPFTPQKNIRIATSDRADGPYGPASVPITGDYWAEGPSAIKVGDKWFVYFDKYRQGKYGLVASADLERWEDLSDKVNFPEGARHGTVFQVSDDILVGLLKL